MLGKALLIIAIVVAIIFALRYWTAWRKEKRGVPVFSVKAMQHTVLSQPVLQTTAVFEYTRGEQDWILLKKYYRGRVVSAGGRKFKIENLKKLPAGNWRDTCYYRMYFQEYQGKEFPRKLLIRGHVRYWKCFCRKKKITFYDHIGGFQSFEYQELAMIIQKKCLILVELSTKRRFTVLYQYNFDSKDYEVLKEILIKYSNLGLAKSKRDI